MFIVHCYSIFHIPCSTALSTAGIKQKSLCTFSMDCEYVLYSSHNKSCSPLAEF